MRFAFIANNTYVPWGGSEELWAQTAGRLRSSGAEVLACVQDWRPRPVRIEALATSGVRLHALRRKRGAALWAMIQRLSGRPITDALTTAFRSALVPFRPDLVVISQMQNLDGIRWATGCMEHHLPFALIAQAASDGNWPRDSEFTQLREAHAAARALFYVSEHNRQLTAEMLGARLSQASVVRNPFLVPYDESLHWPDGASIFRLACVARLETSAKGQDILFRVLAQPKWRARPLQVVLYGQGPNSCALSAMAQLLELSPTVRFAGHVHDIPAIWREHHGLILPSRAEGAPLALVEAMLCHRLAIVTDVGGNAELVEHNISGFVAPTASVAALDAALEQAWTRRSQWREMGIAAGQRIRSLVPPDPAGAFAEKLIAAARGAP